VTDGSSAPWASWMARLPPKRTPGLRIGLFGGSFNPAHEGHRLASLIALERLQLDRVWWLVSPGNPLKSRRDLQSLDVRAAQARRVADHPHIDVTTVEAALGSSYTVDILQTLKARCPALRFVWIMGADNLGSFPRWQRWTEIAKTVPIAVVDRPGSTVRGQQGCAATFLGRWRVPEHRAAALAERPAPAYAFLHGPRSAQSSTALRRASARTQATLSPGGRGGRTGSS
jgi:nicotinate-nucleotide adenylyltransferase